MVDPVAGTTVDPVDSLVELDGETWRFVDTAGLRRRVRTASGMEYYASLRTQAAIDAAEVVIVLVDASEPLTEQDQRVIGMVNEAGRALVLAFNKWDLVDDDRRAELRRELDRDLARVSWAERVNVSALTGRAVNKIAPALRTALESWDKRVSTGALNAWLGEVVAATPPPVRGGKQPKILFATQAQTRPPTFVVFTTGFLEAGYRRFLERRLREQFGFTGSPDPDLGPGPGAPQPLSGSVYRVRNTHVRSTLFGPWVSRYVSCWRTMRRCSGRACARCWRPTAASSRGRRGGQRRRTAGRGGPASSGRGPGRRTDARRRRAGRAAARSVPPPDAPPAAVLTTFDLDEYIAEALRIGVHGFLLKDAEPAAPGARRARPGRRRRGARPAHHRAPAAADRRGVARGRAGCGWTT